MTPSLELPVPERLRALEGRAAVITATEWWPEQPVRIAGWTRDTRDTTWYADVCLIDHRDEPQMELVALEDVLVPTF